MKTLKKKVNDGKGNRDSFIADIADFLASDVARKSIELEMNAKGIAKPDAVSWAKIRRHFNIGYGDKVEFIEAINRLLFVG